MRRLLSPVNISLKLIISEELGYLVDAIINTGEIQTFDTDQSGGNLSQEDKILLSRLLLLLNP